MRPASRPLQPGPRKRQTAYPVRDCTWATCRSTSAPSRSAPCSSRSARLRTSTCRSIPLQTKAGAMHLSSASCVTSEPLTADSTASRRPALRRRASTGTSSQGARSRSIWSVRAPRTVQDMRTTPMHHGAAGCRPIRSASRSWKGSRAPTSPHQHPHLRHTTSESRDRERHSPQTPTADDPRHKQRLAAAQAHVQYVRVRHRAA